MEQFNKKQHGDTTEDESEVVSDSRIRPELQSGMAGFGNRPLTRREFVARLSVVAAGAGFASLGILTPNQRAEAAEILVDDLGKLPRVRLGTRMGDMRVSRIVMCSDMNAALFGPAIAAGANFMHKAGYMKEMPPELAKLPRESYYTDITVDSTPNNPDNEDQAYNQVTMSLDRNGFKYYDIFRAHFGWKTVDAFKNQTGTYKAFLRLKKEGKVRFFGVSQHPWVPYPEVIQAEIDSGLIDSMQVWFSASTKPDVLEIFAQAHKAGIGMTAMKTYAQGSGAMTLNPDLQKQLKADGMIGRACVRYALTTTSPVIDNKPVFHCCVSMMSNLDNLQENLGAMTARSVQRDGFVLST